MMIKKCYEWVLFVVFFFTFMCIKGGTNVPMWWLPYLNRKNTAPCVSHEAVCKSNRRHPLVFYTNQLEMTLKNLIFYILFPVGTDKSPAQNL